MSFVLAVQGLRDAAAKRDLDSALAGGVNGACRELYPVPRVHPGLADSLV